MDIRRRNGTTYRREDSLPGTATPLGQIAIPASLNEAQQLQRLQRISNEFLAQPETTDDGERILLPGYESWIEDTSREELFDRGSTEVVDGAERMEVAMHLDV